MCPMLSLRSLFALRSLRFAYVSQDLRNAALRHEPDALDQQVGRDDPKRRR